jgi:hypothetical protein
MDYYEIGDTLSNLEPYSVIAFLRNSLL